MKAFLLKILYKLLGYKTNGQVIQELIDKKILTVGKYTYQWQSLLIDIYKGSAANVRIGKFCSLSKNIRLITGGIHPVNWVSTFPFRSKFDMLGKFEDGMPTTKGDIIVENDVWIGTGVTILSGVRIGNGAVITAGAMVTKDVPDYSIVGGVPAKVIRYRFTPKQIAALLDLQWWDWEEEKIKANVSFFSSENVDAFIQEHQKK